MGFSNSICHSVENDFEIISFPKDILRPLSKRIRSKTITLSEQILKELPHSACNSGSLGNT